MSLDTYDNLKQEIIDWSHRDDMDLRIDTFIDLAESEMFANQFEPLRLLSQETTVTATMDSTTPSRFLPLPTGFQSMRKVSVLVTNASPYEVAYVTPSAMNVSDIENSPCFFTVTNQIEFDRNPDQDYVIEFKYIQDFTPLSSINTTNNVLTNHPTIYLFGVLWALYNWTDEQDKAQTYYQRFISAIKGANNKADMGRYGPGPSIVYEGTVP